jgi:GrpB-like predicted nucleotidyltransferase (UPF0157 family)
MLIIHKSRKSFYRTFVTKKNDLRKILGDSCVFEHVGSTSVPYVDGKGIIDILIGLDGYANIDEAVNKLTKNGYFLGRNPRRKKNVFMSSVEGNTMLGDVHLHLVLKNSKDFNDFIKVRDFLRQNPKEAQKYSKLKYKIAEETNYDREKYKKQKSKYIEEIIDAVG